ncbi:hypothetical protein CLOM_g6368 [Closterium sp. NIES-68]|nr:hypothetical protein CLOM_g6368 [Closterium sp. NIES-68]GJP68856.1 hypothetical protein CLOP_g25505 [Closterium sp. NIES-67]
MRFVGSSLTATNDPVTVTYRSLVSTSASRPGLLIRQSRLNRASRYAAPRTAASQLQRSRDIQGSGFSQLQGSIDVLISDASDAHATAGGSKSARRSTNDLITINRLATCATPFSSFSAESALYRSSSSRGVRRKTTWVKSAGEWPENSPDEDSPDEDSPDGPYEDSPDGPYENSPDLRPEDLQRPSKSTQSAQSTQQPDRVFVASIPLDAPPGPPQWAADVAGRLFPVLCSHWVVIIAGENGERYLFDFRPDSPQDMGVALRVLTLQSVPGYLLIRPLSHLPSRRCWCVGLSAHSDTLDAVQSFNATWRTDLTVFSHDCRDYSQALASHLIDKAVNLSSYS